MPDEKGKETFYPRPFRTREAAAWLGISEKKLTDWARQGVIKGHKGGGVWYFSQEELARFAASYGISGELPIAARGGRSGNGERSLEKDEAALLDAYRAASEKERAIVRALLM